MVEEEEEREAGEPEVLAITTIIIIMAMDLAIITIMDYIIIMGYITTIIAIITIEDHSFFMEAFAVLSTIMEGGHIGQAGTLVSGVMAVDLACGLSTTEGITWRQ